MEHSATAGYFVPIACRFVPHDRWLVTHLHTSWKITEVKIWLLAKYFPALFTQPPSVPHLRLPQRRVSPITFARREEISDDEQVPAGHAEDDTDYFSPLPGDDDDDPVLSDKYKYVPRTAPEGSSSDIIPKASASSHYADPANFILLSYSTNQILEDGWRFGWYTIRPHELLELHTYPYVVKLPRSSVSGYYQPYFESSAWVLRLIDDFGSSSRAVDGLSRLGESVDADKDKLRKRKKYAQWHQRWIVIRDGFFHLYKDRNELNWQYRVEIASMVAIRGVDYLKEVRQTTIDHYTGPRDDFHEKRIICVKFRHQSQQAENSTWFRRGSRDASAGDESRQGSLADHGNLDDEVDDSWTGDTAVFFLLMHDDTAFDNISRVIHRDSYPCPTSFFPYVGIRHRSPHRRRQSYSPLSFAEVNSPGESPSSSPEPSEPPRTPSPPTPTLSSVRYPEWRIDVVRKAWRAGLGDVGRAMELARFGNDEDPDAGASDHEDNLPDELQQRGRTLNEKWGVLLDDESDGNGSDGESEREWEGWEADHASGRARRPLPFYFDGIHPAPTADYSFPPQDGQSSRKSLNAARRSLNRWSSVDSLKKHSVQRMTPIRNYGPVQVIGRAESPSPGVGRSRPRSPLASGELDNSEVLDMIGMEPGLAVTTPQEFIPDVAYPTRRPSHESSLRSTSGPANSTRGHVVPFSMAMSTITSTVTAGDSSHSKKGKGKGKTKANTDTPQKMARKRSLTVQGPLPTFSRPSVTDSLRDSVGTHSQGTVEGSADRPSTAKSGKIKLALSFAQVAAMGSGPSSSSLAPPLSSTTGSSFESPTFAHPSDSE